MGFEVEFFAVTGSFVFCSLDSLIRLSSSCTRRSTVALNSCVDWAGIGPTAAGDCGFCKRAIATPANTKNKTVAKATAPFSHNGDKLKNSRQAANAEGRLDSDVEV